MTKQVKELTREQFIKQFKYEVKIGTEGKKWLKLDRVYKGVEVYRACNLLLIKIDGKFYGT